MTLVIFATVNAYLYVRGAQLKIVDDISPSESQLLQKEFGITLPSGAQITRSGYCSDEIVIRIEGVEDLSTFLTDSLHCEFDKEALQAMTDRIYKLLDGENSTSKELCDTERNSVPYWNYEYQTNPINRSTMTSFYILDGKLVIEIKKSDVTAANREEIKKIYKRGVLLAVRFG
jgi:hypothetical protein